MIHRNAIGKSKEINAEMPPEGLKTHFSFLATCYVIPAIQEAGFTGDLVTECWQEGLRIKPG
jgi:hypothetical protein